MTALPLSPSLLEIESTLRDRLWRGDMLVRSNQSISSGFNTLDAQLPGGGWPTRCLSELLVGAPGLGEIRLLAPVLSHLSQARRQIILLLPQHEDHRLVYPDGWAQLGIDPSTLLMVRATRPADRLWALEQALRSASFGALIGWVDPLRPEALRRLQVAAAGADGLSFLFRPENAQHHASPAPLRLILGTSPNAGERKLSVRILKRRGPVLAAPLLLNLATPRPLRAPAPHRVPVAEPALPKLNRHALGRPLLSYSAARSHPAPAA
jgi:protein ImuA